MAFPTICFHAHKVKPFKKKFGKVLICFVNTLRCGIISVTGYCDSFEEIKQVTQKDIENKQTKY